MAQWSLFVDESGRFDGNRISVVAGLLVPASGRALAPNPNHSPLRDRFARIWGPAPFPPHAGVYANAVGQALLAGIRVTAATSRGARDAMLPDGAHGAARREAAQAAIGLLRESSFADRLRRLEDGSNIWVGHAEVRAAQAVLRESPHGRAALEPLDVVVQRQRLEMNRLVRRALERVPGTRALFVRADDHADDHAAGPAGRVVPGTRLVRDRYVDALALLLRRALRVVPGTDALDIQVLSRNVQFRLDGPEVHTGPLGAGVLRELVDAVRADVGTDVRTSVGSVLHYRDRRMTGDHGEVHLPLHPFLVFADWVATTGAARLGSRTISLGQLEGMLYDLCLPTGSLRAPVHTPGLGTLPLPAAAGPAEARVEAALARAASLPPPIGRPTWAVEQCEAWVAAAGGAA